MARLSVIEIDGNDFNIIHEYNEDGSFYNVIQTPWGEEYIPLNVSSLESFCEELLEEYESGVIL